MSKPFKNESTDVVIDIETLAISVEKPVILSIGAVAFNKEGIQQLFKIPVDLKSSLKLGCDIDADTLLFWLNSPKESIESLKYGINGDQTTYNVSTALYSLMRFINSCSTLDEERKSNCNMWANSPSFDLTIIRNLHKSVNGDDVVWGFRQERDYRTLRDIVDKPPANRFPKHDSLNDCLNQAEFIIEHYLKGTV